MKRVVFIIGIALVACSSSKKNNNNANTNNVSVKKDTVQHPPACLLTMIDHFRSEEKQNPPRQIYSYLYNSQTVYYVTAPCCDFFSDLYDSNCTLIGHPDGGFTGRGDGKMNDFKDKRSNEKLIWKDERK